MERSRLFRPYSIKNDFEKLWMTNFHREPGEALTDKCIVARSPEIFLRTLLDLTSVRNRKLQQQQIVLSIAVVGTANYNDSAISHDKYVCIPSSLAIMRPSGDSLLVPMGIYESSDPSSEAGRRAFYTILRNERFIKVFYGLAAMRNFLDSWIPAGIVADAQAVYDIAYMYHGYPNSSLGRYGAIMGIRDYQHLADVKTLHAMFRQSFGSECSATQPAWHEEYWDTLSQMQQVENMVSWLVAQMDLFTLFLLVGTARYLPEPLREGMDRLQRKLVDELVGLENFMYICDWIIVHTHEDMDWEPAKEETTNRAGSLLLDMPSGVLVESEADFNCGTEERGKEQQEQPSQGEAAILASSLLLDMPSGKLPDLKEKNIIPAVQETITTVKAMEVQSAPKDTGSKKEARKKESTMEDSSSEPGPSGSNGFVAETKKCWIPPKVFKFIQSYSSQILFQSSLLPASKVLRGIYAFGQLQFFVVRLCHDILCSGNCELLSLSLRVLKRFVFARIFQDRCFGKVTKQKSKKKRPNRKERKKRRQDKQQKVEETSTPNEVARPQESRPRREGRHDKCCHWRRDHEQAREGTIPVPHQLKQAWMQRRTKRFHDLKAIDPRVGGYIEKLIAIHKRYQHCRAACSNPRVWAAKAHLWARRAKSMAGTELLRTRCGRPSSSQPRTVDPTSEVPQLAEEFARMVHIEEQKKKIQLTRMALIKNRPNMTATEYQNAIKKLEQEMRLLALRQPKRNVNFWEYHLERMDREEAMGKMEREYQQTRPMQECPVEREEREACKKHRMKRRAYYECLNQVKRKVEEHARQQIEQRAYQLLVLNFGLSPSEATEKAEAEFAARQL